MGDTVCEGRWSFVRHHNAGRRNTWLWQRFAPDGRVEKTSAEFETYGKALVDALNEGFRPNAVDYSVDLPHGRMHFPPGRDPEFELTLRRWKRVLTRTAKQQREEANPPEL